MTKPIEDKLDKIPVLNLIVRFFKRIKLPGFEGLSSYDLLELYIMGIVNGALTTRASAIAFSFFTAIFPFLLFVIIIMPTQSSGDGPAPTELPQQIFYIDRITEENPLTITFELTTAFDLEGITVPNRFILANVCTWLYQGNAEDLPGATTPLGACSWRQDNTFNGDSTFVIAYDSANRVLLDNSYASFATAMPGSGSLSANHLYSKAITLNYADGSGTNATNEYFQALGAFDASPFDAANFRRVRMYTTWSSATSYKIYKEGRVYNPCVIYNNKIWVAVADNANVTPGSDDNVWERIDICGKKLSSCAARYRVVKYTGQTSVVIPSATEENNEEVLPYGGFPAAKRYNR